MNSYAPHDSPREAAVGYGGGPPTYRLGGYSEFPAPEDLADHVALVWRYARPEGAAGVPAPGHRVLPETGISLCFECRRDERGKVLDGRLVLIGPSHGTRFFDPPAGLHLEAVRLEPEWAIALLAVRPFDHTDGVDGFGEAVGHRVAGPLRERLVRSVSSEHAIDMLLDWIRARAATARHTGTWRSARLAHEGLSRFRAARTNLRPGRVAREVGASERHLRRVVHDLTGQSPKYHHRVGRLGRTVAAADRAGASPEWARLASASGFYDQAHLIREFRDLVGLTPTATHAERAVQHVPG